MITLSSVYARVKRQKIEEFAGEYFLSRNDIVEKIPSMNSHKDQQFLFGVYHSENKWTVLSVNFLYAACDSGFTTLRLDTDTNTIYNHFIENDFSGDIHLKDGRHIWMKSPELSSLILNIMLMLKTIPCGTLLK